MTIQGSERTAVEPLPFETESVFTVEADVAKSRLQDISAFREINVVEDKGDSRNFVDIALNIFSVDIEIFFAFAFAIELIVASLPIRLEIGILKEEKTIIRCLNIAVEKLYLFHFLKL